MYAGQKAGVGLVAPWSLSRLVFGCQSRSIVCRGLGEKWVRRGQLHMGGVEVRRLGLVCLCSVEFD